MAASDGHGTPPEMREAFGHGLVELGAEMPTIIVLDADLNTSSRTDRFKDAYPTRFIQVGIAEQDLFGIAAGLALEGFIAVPSTFAVFAARRALDQIAISICYPGLNVKIPGRTWACPPVARVPHTTASRTSRSCARCPTCGSPTRVTTPTCARSCAPP